jgi:hypothetical protein
MLIVIGFMILFSTSAEARWWRQASITKEMELSKEQIESFDRILAEAQKTIQGLQIELEKYHADLLRVLKEDKTPAEKKTAEANGLVSKIVEANGKILQKRYGMKIQILQMLKSKQVNTLMAKYPRALERPWDIAMERGGVQKK